MRMTDVSTIVGSSEVNVRSIIDLVGGLGFS